MNTTPGFAFEKTYSPVMQAAIALTGALILMILGTAASAAGMEFTDRYYWMVSGAMMLLYALFNSIFSLSAKEPVKYWGRSVFSYIGLAIGASLLAWAFSGISLQDAGSFQWIYLVLSLGYLIFLSLMNVLKNIVEFAMREDWQNPRIKNNDKKTKK